MPAIYQIKLDYSEIMFWSFNLHVLYNVALSSCIPDRPELASLAFSLMDSLSGSTFWTNSTSIGGRSGAVTLTVALSNSDDASAPEELTTSILPAVLEVEHGWLEVEGGL